MLALPEGHDRQPFAGAAIAPPRPLTTPITGIARPLRAPVAPLEPAPAPADPLSSIVSPVGPVVATDQGYLIDGYLNELTNASMFQGAVLVARNGQVLLSKGYGSANTDTGTPNTNLTRIRLASLTKQFTAAAILILQARGALTIQDPICTYFDPCPAAWQPITIQHLLNHTSGLPNYTDFADFEFGEALPTTPAELTARFRDLPLLFAPGTLYSYGNSGYVLLGQIIERASGQTYEEFLRQAIFEPLGMHDSGVDHNIGAVVEGAAGYSYGGQKSPFLDVSNLFACGSLYSTVEDLYRWDQALLSDRLLPQALRGEMFSPGLGNYGYGWVISDSNGHRLISHQGNISGFSTYIARYPDQGVTVIVLSNLEATNAPGVGAYLASMALGV